MEKVVFLEGKRVYLRPLDMDDLEVFCEWFNSPELRIYLPLTHPITKEGEKEFLEKMMKDENAVNLSIIAKEGDKLLGNIGLIKMHSVYRHAELGIAMGALDEVSKGYGTEAVELMLDYGFGTLNLHRIELFHVDFNERARRVYEKVGFKYEGTRREFIYVDGKYHDWHMMSILKSEWRKKK